MAEESETQPSTTQSSLPKSSEEKLNQSQVQAPGFKTSPNGDIPMLPIMYPALMPGLIPLQNQDPSNCGAGIYAVPVLPFMGPMAGIPFNTLVPLTYNIPTRPSPPEGGAVGEEQEQEGQQHNVPQRQVVARRFHFAFQLDLLLILKLAFGIYLFNQDGSRQRLILLVFFASLFYLYRTGALTPFIRWFSQGMQRAGAPPHRLVVLRAENDPEVIRRELEVAVPAEGRPGDENENRPVDDGNEPVENENRAEPGEANAVNWWGVAKEIQMIVVGFVASLLPGFHNID